MSRELIGFLANRPPLGRTAAHVRKGQGKGSSKTRRATDTRHDGQILKAYNMAMKEKSDLKQALVEYNAVAEENSRLEQKLDSSREKPCA